MPGYNEEAWSQDLQFSQKQYTYEATEYKKRQPEKQTQKNGQWGNEVT